MGQMIPISAINGNQFMKACTLMLPIVVVDARTFRMPSASGGEREHTVQFDSAESPTEFSCTCEAGSKRTACWASARALDTLRLFSVNQIYIWGRAPSGPHDETPSTASTVLDVGPLLKASIDEQGEMALTTLPTFSRDDNAVVLVG